MLEGALDRNGADSTHMCWKGGFLHWLALWELGSWITSFSVAVIKYGDCGNVWKRSFFGLSSGGLDSIMAAGSRSRKLRAHTLNCKRA